MDIVSPDQYQAFASGRFPEPEEFAQGVWFLPVALPAQMPGGAQSFSYAYLIDDFSGAVHVIDPGWPLPENLQRWEELLGKLGKSFDDVATVTATHFHPDHLGLAPELCSRSGAPLIMHEHEAHVLGEAQSVLQDRGEHAAHMVLRPYALFTEERLKELQVPEQRWSELTKVGALPVIPQPTMQVKGGDSLPVNGRDIKVVWTPGHTGGHMCLVEEEAGVFFSADHVLPHINSGVGLGGVSPSNPMVDYLTALNEVARYDSYIVAPGHEYLFRGLSSRAEQLRNHHLGRSQEVLEAMSAVTSVWDIASKVTWSDGFENLRSYKLGSALSQVSIHMDLVVNHREWLA